MLWHCESLITTQNVSSRYFECVPILSSILCGKLLIKISPSHSRFVSSIQWHSTSLINPMVHVSFQDRATLKYQSPSFDWALPGDNRCAKPWVHHKSFGRALCQFQHPDAVYVERREARYLACVRCSCPDSRIDKMAEILSDAGHLDCYAMAECLGDVILTCMGYTHAS